MVLNDTSRVTSGGVRQIRAVMRTRDSDAWVGVAFGFSDPDNLSRVLVRPVDNCFELQTRVGGVTENVASGFDDIPVDTDFEMRVTYGDEKVVVQLYDAATLQPIGGGFTAAVAGLTATALPPHVAFYSSNNRNGAVFESMQVSAPFVFFCFFVCKYFCCRSTLTMRNRPTSTSQLPRQHQRPRLRPRRSRPRLRHLRQSR